MFGKKAASPADRTVFGPNATRQRGATVLLLRPGRAPLRIELPAKLGSRALALLLVPVLMGAVGGRAWAARSEEPSHGLGKAPVEQATDAAAGLAPRGDRVRASATETGTVHGAAPVHRVAASPHGPEPASVPSPPVEPRLRRAVISERPMVAAFLGAVGGEPRLASKDALRPAAQGLSIHAVHLGESVQLNPFDSDGRPVPKAFAALRHLMRCRVTGEEVAIDPRLVRLLSRIAEVYQRPIDLISGHRAVNVLGTSSTSQHVHGRAADIRVHGVSVEALRRRAIALGARGVGLYPENHFLHIDVRNKPKYFWAYTKATGEQPYDEFVRDEVIAAVDSDNTSPGG